MALRRWPSWPVLVMDLVAAGRLDHGWPAVDSGITFDASIDPLPRYLVNVIDPNADVLEAVVTFDLETLASSYAEAERLAYDADGILMGYPVSVSSGGRVVLVDRVNVLSSPAELKLEEESRIRRFLATYQLVVRRG